MPGLDFDSDHRLLSINLRILAPIKQYWGRQLHKTQTKRIPRLNVSSPLRADIAEQYNQLMFEMTRNALTSDIDLWQYAARSAGEVLWRPDWTGEASMAGGKRS